MGLKVVQTIGDSTGTEAHVQNIINTKLIVVNQILMEVIVHDVQKDIRVMYERHLYMVVTRLYKLNS